MKRKLLWILGGIVGLLAIAAVVVAFSLGSIVKKGVITYGPRITQTRVELNGAQVSPFSGSGTLTGFAVGNPQGWSAGNAFYLGKVHLDMVPSSVFTDHLIINEILIDKPEFSYETRIVTSNIQELLSNIEKSTTSPDKSNQPVAKNGQPMKFEVKKFTLRNGKLIIGVADRSIHVSMPPLVLTDLGTKEGGLTVNQLAAAVTRSILGEVVSATAQAAGKIGGISAGAATDAATETAKKAGEALQSLFGSKPKH